MQQLLQKTRIVCTIGPASEKVETIIRMLHAGMNVARLNFSHGDPEYHAKIIANIRTASEQSGMPVAIMADLPGPKMRIGSFVEEPVELEAGQEFTLTTVKIIGDRTRVSVTMPELPRAVASGDTLYLNDGFISLLVDEVAGPEVRCLVRVGGELRSRKGLNLPGMDLGISAFTENDHRWLAFAAEQRLDAVSQSFVGAAEDLQQVRDAAEAMEYHPFIIAKIERSKALERLDAIIEAADGIMVARGDLGVETPIEQIALVQKRIINQARLAGRPVITATQMLESMTENRRPTRAEATDVANAILDGTDCIMLSGESAMGKFPVEAVAMLAAIARATEKNLPESPVLKHLTARDTLQYQVNLLALGVHTIVAKCDAAMLIVPTQSGATARNIARFRHNAWIHAVTMSSAAAASMLFSFGVCSHLVASMPEDWNMYVRHLADRLGLGEGGLALLTEGPSPLHPHTNHRLELISL